MCCDWRRGHRTLSRGTDASLDCAFVKNTLVFVVPKGGRTWGLFGNSLTLRVFFVIPRLHPQFMIGVAQCTPSSEEPLGFGAGN